MLQRAAGNAYSWWWASHIRTKQSKWLEQNLHDMEEKVSYALKIIDEDGETFAQRAEMYYRKRPEIVNFVEEAFRSYRALAERYDHLSREFQSANRTIATAFPEHIQFHLDDDEDEEKQPNKPSKHGHLVPKANNIPKVPEIPKKGFRSQSMMLSRNGKRGLRRTTTSAARREMVVVSSGLSKEQALKEIDKLQKGILAFQTEKEFVRNSYEHSCERYWGIENEISEMQKRVCSLQDEFGIGSVIDDCEARKLMASTALSSCKDSIAKLEEKQKQSVEVARIEKERIVTAKEKFEALRKKFDQPESDEEGMREEAEENVYVNQDTGFESTIEWEQIDSNENLSVVQLAEKIDELVERVVSLETTISSQTALTETMRAETDKLHEHIRGLEEDKASLISDSIEMEKRIRALEEELSRVKSLHQRVEDQNKKLEEQFTEANSQAEELSGKLQSVKMEEDVEGAAGLFQEVRVVSGDFQEEKPRQDLNSIQEEQDTENSEQRNEEVSAPNDEDSDKDSQEQAQQEKPEMKDSSALSETASTCFGTEQEDLGTEDYDEETPNWRQLLPNGIEDREKVILEEYTSVLRDYREVKRKLSEVEKKNRDGFFDLALQIRELKNAVAYKDMEIQSLRQKLDMPEKDSSNPVEGNQSDGEGQPEIISISPFSNLSVSTTGHQQGGDFKKTPARTRGSELRVKFADADESPRTSIPTVEDKVRAGIDALLEENLEFWLRFSTSVHQIQKFQSSIQDLKFELSRLNIEDRKHQDSSNPERINQQHASEARPIYRHLREIRTELQLWLENSEVLREELQGRYTSLCNIQDEISRLTSHTGSGRGGDTEISGYQAAKFHGEVLTMKQENKKVSNELRAGHDRVKTLKIEVERVLGKMEQDLGISSNGRTQNKNASAGWPRIPLRTFLFGVKLKKHKQQKSAASLFSCVSPSPNLQRQDSYISPP